MQQGHITFTLEESMGTSAYSVVATHSRGDAKINRVFNTVSILNNTQFKVECISVDNVLQDVPSLMIQVNSSGTTRWFR